MKTKSFKISLRRYIFKFGIDEDTLFLALALFIGAGAGVLAVGFGELIHFLTDFFQTTEKPTLNSVTAGAAFLLLAAYLIFKYSPKSSGSGVPEIKISIVVDQGKVGVFDWVSKLVISVLSLSSGMVLGREGPTMAITSGFGSSLAQLFSLSQVKVKSLMAVGAAGGIAAAFNTPIAAVTLIMEEFMDNLSGRSIGPIIIASVTASITANVLHGGESMFAILKHRFDDISQLPYYVLVGIACALVGSIWVKFLLKFRAFNVQYFKEYRIFAILLVFFGLMGIGYFLPIVLGNGEYVLNQVLLSAITDWKTIALLLVIKFVFAAACYATGISGGIFMPTLFMGGMTGCLVGIVANHFSIDGVDVGAFALVGMGAYFATVIRAPFTSIIIIFELTQDYRVVLPLMLANIIAYLVSQKFLSGSIYELISEQNGVHLPDKNDHEVLEQLTVKEAMICDVKTLEHNFTVKKALKLINHSEISGYPVMKKNFIIGVVSSSDIGRAYGAFKGADPLEDVCTKKLITIYPDQSLMIAFHYLNKYRISRLLVVSRLNDNKLVGIITPEDIVNRFGFHIDEESKYDAIDKYLPEDEKGLE